MGCTVAELRSLEASKIRVSHLFELRSMICPGAVYPKTWLPQSDRAWRILLRRVKRWGVLNDLVASHNLTIRSSSPLF